MEWFRKHGDTAAVLSALVLAVWWLTSSVSTLELKLHGEIASVKSDIAELKTELAVIKTVLIMKQIMPCELANKSVEP